MQRTESSHLININSSLFDFQPLPDELMLMNSWYEEGKIHNTLANYMVRSKSEVIIANMMFDRNIPFKYEIPLFAPDDTFYNTKYQIATVPRPKPSLQFTPEQAIQLLESLGAKITLPATT